MGDIKEQPVIETTEALRRELATIGALINEREGELAEVIQQANSHINLINGHLGWLRDQREHINQRLEGAA